MQTLTTATLLTAFVTTSHGAVGATSYARHPAHGRWQTEPHCTDAANR